MNHSGIWDQTEADKYHQSSPKLAAWLASYLPKEEHVIDFGAGNGYYLSELAKQGFKCTGVEGMKLNNFLHDNMLIHDLTQPIHLVAKGSVLCLEVMEHVPECGEKHLLNSIVEHSTGIVVMSWATPGQPGVGHINCKPHKYVIEEMKFRGFIFDLEKSKEARENADEHTSWFKRNLMVFAKG